MYRNPTDPDAHDTPARSTGNAFDIPPKGKPESSAATSGKSLLYRRPGEPIPKGETPKERAARRARELTAFHPSSKLTYKSSLSQTKEQVVAKAQRIKKASI